MKYLGLISALLVTTMGIDHVFGLEARALAGPASVTKAATSPKSNNPVKVNPPKDKAAPATIDPNAALRSKEFDEPILVKVLFEAPINDRHNQPKPLPPSQEKEVPIIAAKDEPPPSIIPPKGSKAPAPSPGKDSKPATSPAPKPAVLGASKPSQ